MSRSRSNNISYLWRSLQSVIELVKERIEEFIGVHLHSRINRLTIHVFVRAAEHCRVERALERLLHVRQHVLHLVQDTVALVGRLVRSSQDATTELRHQVHLLQQRVHVACGTEILQARVAVCLLLLQVGDTQPCKAALDCVCVCVSREIR
jgi:hypothetical protein